MVERFSSTQRSAVQCRPALFSAWRKSCENLKTYPTACPLARLFCTRYSPRINHFTKTFERQTTPCAELRIRSKKCQSALCIQLHNLPSNQNQLYHETCDSIVGNFIFWVQGEFCHTGTSILSASIFLHRIVELRSVWSLLRLFGGIFV